MLVFVFGSAVLALVDSFHAQMYILCVLQSTSQIGCQILKKLISVDFEEHLNSDTNKRMVPLLN